jgi:hypothetical protein
MIVQDLNSINVALQTLIRRGVNPSLSTLFRNARMDGRITRFGDFPILSHVILFAKSKGYFFNRREINSAINTSEELSESLKSRKSEVLDQLVSLAREV